MEKERKRALKTFQKKFRYRFKNLNLLDQSLRHRSFAHEIHDVVYEDNERLEFLGDAVLDLIIGHLLLERHPYCSEGDLSKLRAAAVNASRLAKVHRILAELYEAWDKPDDADRHRQAAAQLEPSNVSP